MNKVLVRSVSGIVYIALIVGAIMLGQKEIVCLMAFFGILALNEFMGLTVSKDGNRTLRTVSLMLSFAAVGLMTGSALAGISATFWIAASLVAILIVRLTLALYDKSPSALRDVASWALGTVYIGIPLACACVLSPEMLLAVFVMIWLNDTGAYCTGSLFGKHKLFERHSPKKTWEGFFGGLFFCILGSVVFALIDYVDGMNIWQWIGAGLLTGVFATWGDLFESFVKRTFHTKDAGNLIPGHGGILDRIDSLLFVAPVILVYKFILVFLSAA